MKLTQTEADDLQMMLAEGFHTAFRKATDHPLSTPIWKNIKDLPTEDWGSVLDFVMSGVRPWIEDTLLPAVIKRSR